VGPVGDEERDFDVGVDDVFVEDFAAFFVFGARELLG